MGKIQFKNKTIGCSQTDLLRVCTVIVFKLRRYSVNLCIQFWGCCTFSLNFSLQMEVEAVIQDKSMFKSEALTILDSGCEG